jgi:hypothetical protein
MIRYLKEGFDEKGTPDLKYYAFDWDDNIVYMPTNIMVLNDVNKEIGMSTEDFAKYRHMIGLDDFNYKDNRIVGYAEDPFRHFGVNGDKRFIIDSVLAQPGPSWSDFVECINGGSIFSIITARGHKPSTIKEAVYNYIISNTNGINNQDLVKNLKKYREFMDEENMKNIELINSYLDLCQFYPVTYGKGSAANPEEEKVKALKKFVNYVTDLSHELNKKAYIKNDVKNFFLPFVGFSDDDLKNIKKTSEDEFLNKRVKFKYTGKH